MPPLRSAIKRTPPIGRRFQKGQVANPGGRPKAYADVQALARQHSIPAIETLASMLTSKKASASARIQAAIVLLERGWGKPAQPIEHSGPEGAPLAVLDSRQLAVRIIAILDHQDAALREALNPTEMQSINMPGEHGHTDPGS